MPLEAVRVRVSREHLRHGGGGTSERSVLEPPKREISC